MQVPVIDPAEFRRALGQFPTGVTIITCKSAAGEYIGVTASSFSSVSLDPPLVLWSIAKSAWSLDKFSQSKHFAIHVLGAHQRELSVQFARQGADKFDGISLQEGLGGAPLLSDYCARFQCEMLHQYEGGDHLILVGRVLEFRSKPQAPLVFHCGRYAQLEEALLPDTIKVSA